VAGSHVRSTHLYRHFIKVGMHVIHDLIHLLALYILFRKAIALYQLI